ncbi:MAG: bile acid:sodium symporter family protein [Bacteroidales bacterium]|jgi:BASS family bile acid:Na+ symporter|nr:bile acid:sodium symporter family protein [Bacteroidales bacterium]
MHEQLQALDDIRINFSAGSMHIVNIILAFVMYGIALGIRPQTFKNILLFPKSFLVGLFAQIVALPAITFLLVVLFNQWITPMIAMGMILVAACPGGNTSNFMSQLSRANTELSISLSAIGTVITPIFTPVNFWFWGSMYTNFVNNRAGDALQTIYIEYLEMFKIVLLLLGVPLLLGILTVKYLPKIARKMKKPLQYVSMVFFIAMVVIAFNNNLKIFVSNFFIYIFILVLIQNTAVLGTGYGLARLFKVPPKDKRALTIETGIQNSGLGLVLLLNPNIFPPEIAIGGMVLVTAWWGIWHIVSGLSISFYWSRRAAK